MKPLNYLLPSPLVINYGLNIDTLVYIFLLTFLNPIFVWILVYFDTVSLLFALLLDIFWIFRSLNIYLRCCQCLPKAHDKKVLITGGSDGLGYEVVKKLCLRKDIGRIYVVDIKPPPNSISIQFSNKLEFIKFDFNGDIGKFTSSLIKLEEIDILICNAGIRQIKPIQDSDDDELRKIVNVNWISHLILLKNYLQCIKKHDKNRRFHIVVVSSVLGFVGPKNLGIYAGTKNGLLGMMDSLREEIPLNIVLSTILPGQLNSRMFSDVSVNEFLAPVIDIDKLASRIISIVENGINGTFSYPLYGRFLPIYRILPWGVQRFCRYFSGMDNV